MDHGQVLLQRQGQGAEDWAHQSYMSQRENHRERDNIVCPYHVLAQAGDGKQVDRGHQIHHVIDGEEVVEWGVYLLRTRQVGWTGTVVCSHLHCNHLTKVSPECKDHKDKSSCQCTNRSNRKAPIFPGWKVQNSYFFFMSIKEQGFSFLSWDHSWLILDVHPEFDLVKVCHSKVSIRFDIDP